MCARWLSLFAAEERLNTYQTKTTKNNPSVATQRDQIRQKRHFTQGFRVRSLMFDLGLRECRHHYGAFHIGAIVNLLLRELVLGYCFPELFTETVKEKKKKLQARDINVL